MTHSHGNGSQVLLMLQEKNMLIDWQVMDKAEGMMGSERDHGGWDDI